MLNFLFETFRLGIKNLFLHKLRSLLTALGIIFGVGAVIAMLAIGQGSKRAALEQMQQLGVRNVLLRSVPPPESSDASGKAQRQLEYGLKRSDVERLRTLPGIAKMIELRDTEQKVVHNELRASANAMGATADVFSVINLPLERGRYFTSADEESRSPVCVLGALAARQLFPYQDPLGETIRVGTGGMSIVVLTVVGVLEPTGLRGDGAEMMKRNLDQDVYFPLTLAQATFGDTIILREPGSMVRKRIELSEIWLQVDRTDQVEQLAAIADNTIRSAHGGVIDVEVKAPIQILRSAEHISRTFNFVLGGIAAVSLLVGGIGIMNIMLASVTERTREIGIRRALGAKRRHIILQFLIETTVISLAGGLIGIIAGVTVATALPIVVNWFTHQDYPTEVAGWSVGASFIVSIAIGIAFGLYPAVLAARMSPIEALRHE